MDLDIADPLTTMAVVSLPTKAGYVLRVGLLVATQHASAHHATMTVAVVVATCLMTSQHVAHNHLQGG